MSFVICFVDVGEMVNPSPVSKIFLLQLIPVFPVLLWCFQAFSVRNAVQTSQQRLNEFRGNILYKITILEVLLPPLNGRLHQSLSHLKTVQFFLDNQAWTRSERVRRAMGREIGAEINPDRNEEFQSENIGRIKLRLWRGVARSLWPEINRKLPGFCRNLQGFRVIGTSWKSQVTKAMKS